MNIFKHLHYNLSVLFLTIASFGQTTTYIESFTTSSLTSSYTIVPFTSNIGTWSPGGGGCGLSSVAINTNTLKLKTGVSSSATTPVLKGITSISYLAKTLGAPSSLTVTDGNATFSDTKLIGTSVTASGSITIPNNSNGIYTFTYPNTASVTGEYIDDVVFTFNKPQSQATSITTSVISSTALSINWTRPNNGNDNQGCIVFIGPSNASFVPPTDGVSYVANTVFGSGSQLSNSGFYCVYNGTAATVSISGLNSAANYSIYVLEYNGINGQSDENYNTNNPAIYPPIPTISVSTNTSPLSDFSANFSTPSVPQSFIVSGALLTNSIILTAPLDFEISTNSSSGYTNSLSFVPISGNVPNTIVYARFKSGLATAYYTESIILTSVGANNHNVVCNGTVFSSSPIIQTPSVLQLNGFNYAIGTGPSTPQAFTIGGSYLLDSIQISAPTDYEVSFSPLSGYVSGVTFLLIPPTSGEVSGTVVYVRLKTGLPINTYNLENISISSLGCLGQNVICNGIVTASALVTQQPVNATICEGAATTFTVLSTNSTLPYWQRSMDGINWVTITTSLDPGVTYSGYDSNTLTLSGCTSVVDFYEYRAVYTNAVSNPATLTITPTVNPSIVINGSSTVCLGSTTTFTATDSSTSNSGTINPDDFLTPTFSSVTVTSNVAYGPTNSNFHLVDIYSPTGATSSNRPAVMFFHVGGFTNGNTKTQSYVVAICTYLAKCGYVAFAPNYNVGGGHTFTQNLAAVKDADLCLNWIRANGATYGYNPDYLFEGGGSAGAHLSCNFIFSDNGPNYNGYVVNLCNVIAFADCWGSSPNTDRLYNFSSLNSNSIPCYIVHGSSDTTVPVQESITLNNYLTAAGADVQFWDINGETHGCPNHIPQICAQIAGFFNAAWHQHTSSTPTTINGGVWSSNNPSVATINPTSGLVTPLSSGTTTITFTYTNSCGSPAIYNQPITVCSLSNNQFDSKKNYITPNPTSGVFQISYDFNTVEIYTLTGQLVKSYNSVERNNLSIADLKAGIYIIKVLDIDHNSSISKIIKE